jgi:hypothetical protein
MNSPAILAKRPGKARIAWLLAAAFLLLTSVVLWVIGSRYIPNADRMLYFLNASGVFWSKLLGYTAISTGLAAVAIFAVHVISLAQPLWLKRTAIGIAIVAIVPLCAISFFMALIASPWQTVVEKTTSDGRSVLLSQPTLPHSRPIDVYVQESRYIYRYHSVHYFETDNGRPNLELCTVNSDQDSIIVTCAST